MSTPAASPSDAPHGGPDDTPEGEGRTPDSATARDGADPAAGTVAATPGLTATEGRDVGGSTRADAAAGADGPRSPADPSSGSTHDAPEHAADADLDDPDAIPEDVAPNARPATRKRVWAIQRRRRKHKGRSKPFRVVYVVVASLIFLLGLVSGPLPGPGPVILIPLGLAMLALEFVWAERALAFAMDKAEGAKEGAQKASWKQRLFIVAAVVLFFAAAVSLVFVLDIPIPLLNPGS